jgi:hypothetical protein
VVVRVESGGNIRGASAVARLFSRGPGAAFEVAADQSLLVHRAGEGQSTGGVWARLTASGLLADPGCHSADRLTVWSTDGELVDVVAPFAAALGQALIWAEASLGADPTRLVVEIGGELTTARAGVVHLDRAEVERAVQRGELAQLALHAVAIHRVWLQELTDWADVVALTRYLQRASAPTLGGHRHP